MYDGLEKVKEAQQSTQVKFFCLLNKQPKHRYTHRDIHTLLNQTVNVDLQTSGYAESQSRFNSTRRLYVRVRNFVFCGRNANEPRL